jgi:hypothetical protein
MVSRCGPSLVRTTSTADEGGGVIAYAEERTRFWRSGIYDVTVRRGDEVVAEFRGRSRVVGSPSATDDGVAAEMWRNAIPTESQRCFVRIAGSRPLQPG